MTLISRVLTLVFVLICALAAPAVTNAATHTVSPGESLFTISHSYGVSMDLLAEENGISDSMIYPGQQFRIPEKAEKGSTTRGGTYYTVQAGDNLYQIGKKFGVGYQDVMAANGLGSLDIYPGLELCIPATSGVLAEEQLQAPQVSRGGNFKKPSSADVELLARLITAEADGEPYEGKVAVGAVVLNRVKRAEFPGTIQGVINEYGEGTFQFQPVMNGWIDRPAKPDSFTAAKDALSGQDPTSGAVYFFSKRVNNPWLLARPVSKIIGNHIFTY